MAKFVPVTMRSNLIGEATNRVVYYAVNRIIKIEEDPHGGSILTVTAEDNSGGTMTINSTDSLITILSSASVVNE